MRLLFAFVLFAVSLCFPLASSFSVDPQNDKVTISSETSAWIEDIDILASSMETRHPNLFAKIAAEDFHAAVEELKEKVPNLTENQIAIELMRLVALVQDGHTWMLPFQAALGFSALPIRLYHFTDGLFVTDALEPNDSLIGNKLIRIGATAIEEVTDSLTPLVAHDNEMTILERISQFYIIPEILVALDFGEIASDIEMTFEDESGEQITVVMEPISTADYLRWIEPAPTFAELFPTLLPQRDEMLFLSNPIPNFWMTLLEEENLVYLQYNAVQTNSLNPERPESLSAFARRLSDLIDDNPGVRVAIDLRHNLGGDINTFGPLSQTLSTHQSLQSDKKLFLIIGRRTFSAAGVFTDQMRANGNVVVVGERSGSGLNFFADNIAVVLPNSRIEVAISSRAFNTVREDDRPWHEPDMMIQMSSEQYFSAQDPVLEAILDL